MKGYVIRKTQGKYDSNPRFHVYHASGGKSIDNFGTREEAESYRQHRIDRDAEDARHAEVRELERQAEEIRRACLTDEERQREDDEKALQSELWRLNHENEQLLAYTEAVATGYEHAAKKIREGLEAYKNHTENFGDFRADYLASRIMDTLFFQPQYTREKYPIDYAFKVMERQAIVNRLREKLGITPDQG
jgi:superfamily II DNA or RNA helicase